MTFGIVEFSTLTATFEEDLAAYAAAGIDAIGICELKLEAGREAEQLDALRRSGLAVGCAIPAVPSILPAPALPDPDDSAQRIEAICAGMRRLAPFEPTAFVCLTGPAGRLDKSEARRAVVDGLRTVGGEAERLGIPVGVEPMSAHFSDEWTLITTLAETADLIDEAGSDLLGITFDTWHLWDTPDIGCEIARHGGRIVCVHVADWRVPTRGWCDRALPGDGVADLPSIRTALEAAGWDGCYELEIFSDNGAFGDRYEDSLWDISADAMAYRGREAFLSGFHPRQPGAVIAALREEEHP